MALCALSSLDVRAAADPEEEERRPNVLLIVVDDLSDVAAPFGGAPAALTPHVERLARRGVAFHNAHANAVVCSPSRASLWTGLYPHRTGYYGRQKKQTWRENPTMSDAVTVFEHFQAGGYSLFATGKVYHNGQVDEAVWDDPAAPKGRLAYGPGPSFGPGPWPGVRKARRGRIAFVGHPAFPEGLRDWMDGFGPLSDVPAFENGRTWWNRDGTPFRYVSDDDRDLMPDEQSRQYAVELLGREHDAPFLLAVGFNRPHAPRYAPKEYFDRVPLDGVELPAVRLDDLEDCPHILWRRPNGDIDLGRSWAQGFDALRSTGGERMWRRAVQAYLACTAFVDDQLGAILDALDAGPHADDTIVVFTSDHGFHLGEKRAFGKQTLWEESTRVPLVVVAPGVSEAGRRCDEPVSLIDLYPTLIELCGLPPRPNRERETHALDGHSLRPLLDADTEEEWSGPPVALTSLHGRRPVGEGRGKDEDEVEVEAAAAQHFSVRSRHWRYTLCSDGDEELYDHRVDPFEWRNLARDERFASDKARLRGWMEAIRAGSGTGAGRR